MAILVLLGAGRPAQAEDVPSWAKPNAKQIAQAKKLGIPVAFENRIGMRFILIPTGQAKVGPAGARPPAVPLRVDRGTSRHVTIEYPFYMQVTEVTNDQLLKMRPDDREAIKLTKGKPGNHPVRGISHGDADDALLHLSVNDPDRVYRLPTDAEWEYACRAAGVWWWYWGAQPGDAVKHEHLKHAHLEADDPGPTEPVAVGSLAPNPFGLHDMLGNVMEWVHGPFVPSRRTVPNPLVMPELPRELAPLLWRRGAKGGSFATPVLEARHFRRSPEAEPDQVGFRAIVPLRQKDVGDRALARPFTLRFVSAEDGAPLEVAARHMRDGEDPVPFVDGKIELVPDTSSSLKFAIDVPKGRRLWDGLHKPDSTYAFIRPVPGTKRIEQVLPLYKPVKIQGRIRMPKGIDASKAQVWVDKFGGEDVGSVFGRPAHARAPTPGGRFHFDVLPWIPGAPVVVEAALPDNLWCSGKLTLPSKRKREVKLKERLVPVPDDRGRPIHGGRGIGGSPPIRYEKRTQARCQLSFYCKDAEGNRIRDALVMRGVEWSEHGQLAAVADFAFTDDSGYALLDWTPAGKHTMTIYKAGFGVWTRQITATSGLDGLGSFQATLPAHSKINLTVTRAEGGPAAYADVYLEHDRHAPVDNIDEHGTLRVGPALDHEGRGVLHGLSEGVVTVTVRWLGRRVKKQVVLEEAQTVDLALTLPTESGWGPGVAK